MINKILRFLEIDRNYFSVPLSLMVKIYNILFCNLILVLNIFLKCSIRKIPYNQKLIHVDTPYATKTFLAAIYDFYIETNKLSIFSSHNPTIVDIGANIGQFHLACRAFFPEAKIISIEPDKNIFKLLRVNTKGYKKTNLYNFALSKSNKKINFYINNIFSEWSSLISSDNSKRVLIQSKNGDKVLQNIRNIDLLKIDVEGAEYDVILGLTKTIKRAKYLLIEVSVQRQISSSQHVPNELINFLSKHNYSIYSIGRIFSDGIGGKQGAVDILFKNMTQEVSL